MKKAIFLLFVLCLLVGTVLLIYQHSQGRLLSIVGQYHRGHWYTGKSLNLKADGTYNSSWHSDVRDPTDPMENNRKDRGQYELEDDKVVLTSIKGKTSSRSRWHWLRRWWVTLTSKKREKPPGEFYYIVPCDKRIYLIADSQFPNFVTAIRSGEEPCIPIRNNNFLVRDDKANRIPKGLPQFPEEWRELLKGVKPVDTDILAGEGYVARVMFAANKASNAGNDKKAVYYAQEVLERNPDPPGYAHDVYTVLGLAELRAGNVSSAKEYLRRAGVRSFKEFSSHSTISCKELMKGLCLKGENQAVVDYITAYAHNNCELKKLKHWKQEILANRIPQIFEPEEK